VNADRILAAALAAALLVMAALIVVATGDGVEKAGAGRPRAVDVDLLRRRTIRGELSDREAMYYRKGR
jgi:hypothetical protein